MQGSALVGIFENMKCEIYWEFLFLDYIWTANPTIWTDPSPLTGVIQPQILNNLFLHFTVLEAAKFVTKRDSDDNENHFFIIMMKNV